MKNRIRKNISSITSSFRYPLIVNSYGRSGSTVLTNSIIKNAVTFDNTIIKRIAYRTISEPAWSLENTTLNDGIVYKTHDYPPVNGFESKVRMLYTFADPVDVVLSLLRLYNERGEGWMKEHYDHLKVPYSNFKNIIYEDQLCLEKHLDSWLNESKLPIAFIKYESMWDHQDEISNFLGFNIKLPPYRERKTSKINDEKVIRNIEKTYLPFRKRVSNLGSFFVKNCM